MKKWDAVVAVGLIVFSSQALALDLTRKGAASGRRLDPNKAPVAQLGDLMREIGIQTQADMTTYSCKDYYRDSNALLSLTEGEPNYFDKKRTFQFVGADPLHAQALATFKQSEELVDLLLKYVSFAAAFDELKEPFFMGDTPQKKARIEKLLTTLQGTPTTPANFSAWQAYYMLKRAFDDGFTSNQKKAWVELTSLLANSTLPTDPDANTDLAQAYQSAFVNLDPSPALLDKMRELREKEDQFYGVLGSPEIKTDCLRAELPAFSEFLNKCPKEARLTGELMSVDAVKKINTLKAANLPKPLSATPTPNECRTGFEAIYAQLLSDSSALSTALTLLNENSILLQDAPGKNGVAWTKERAQALVQQLKALPANYRKGLPVISFLSFQGLPGTILGWYWGDISTFITNSDKGSDKIDPHTLYHELSHAWDYQHLRTDAQLIQDWRKAGHIEDFWVNLPGVKPADKTIRFNTTMVAATSYARYNEGEDFAESVAMYILDKVQTKKDIASRVQILESKILK